MKKIISFALLAVLLTACGGNKLELNLDKVQEAIAKEASGQKVIEENGYKKEDIKVVKVCEAVEQDEKDYGFKGQYLVYWQTKDGEFKRELSMTKDYEVGYSTSRLEEIEDRCISVE